MKVLVVCLVIKRVGLRQNTTMPKSQADVLDDNHANSGLGAELMPLHGKSESKLSQARRTKRFRAGSALLAGVLRPEPARRMVRKAGITSCSTSSPADEDVDVVLSAAGYAEQDREISYDRLFRWLYREWGTSDGRPATAPAGFAS